MHTGQPDLENPSLIFPGDYMLCQEEKANIIPTSHSEILYRNNACELFNVDTTL